MENTFMVGVLLAPSKPTPKKAASNIGEFDPRKDDTSGEKETQRANPRGKRQRAKG